MIQQSFIGKYFVIDTYKYKVYSFPILLFLVNIIYRDKHLMPSMYDHDKFPTHHAVSDTVHNTVTL